MRWPGAESITFSTRRSIADSISRLRAISKSEGAPVWRRTPLAGDVAVGGFKVRLGDAGLFPSPTSPVAVGRFESGSGGETVVRIDVRPVAPRPVQVITLLILFGSVFNILFGCVAQYRLLERGEGWRAGFFVWIGFGVAYMLIWGHWLLPFNDAAERERLITRIAGALDGRETGIEPTVPARRDDAPIEATRTMHLPRWRRRVDPSPLSPEACAHRLRDATRRDDGADPEGPRLWGYVSKRWGHVTIEDRRLTPSAPGPHALIWWRPDADGSGTTVVRVTGPLLSMAVATVLQGAIGFGIVGHWLISWRRDGHAGEWPLLIFGAINVLFAFMNARRNVLHDGWDRDAGALDAAVENLLELRVNRMS